MKINCWGNKLNGVLPTTLNGNTEDLHDNYFRTQRRKIKKSRSMSISWGFHFKREKVSQKKDSILSKTYIYKLNVFKIKSIMENIEVISKIR